MSYERVGERLAEVRERVAEAARRAGRAPGAVTVVAVTKRLGLEAVLAAAACGQRDFGENYVQEALGKMQQWPERGAGSELRWHLLGRLQSNKASVAARSFAVLHAIDSLSAVRAISRAAREYGVAPEMFLEIKLGESDQRGGVAAAAAEGFLREAALAGALQFHGLMAVADPALAARPQFAALRELRDRLARLEIPGAPLAQLSMGMSGDFEDAIAEGATVVRLGTVIFGARPGA
ncbi:MAG: YggS family pyridoxal phosphate-dependent enzyme [Deltaproteobacteria bacterium]|nr:YggS family pyridoxal phosphate-dependent enzyme [Deltaproteobacteria bacterium]